MLAVEDIFWGNFNWIKIQVLSERSVNIKIESTLFVSNDGLESKLSASQLKHCTGAYYGSKAEWMDNWIITALIGLWENWFRTLLCSRLQLYLLCEVKWAWLSQMGGSVWALTALLVPSLAVAQDQNIQSVTFEDESSIEKGWTGMEACDKCQGI